MTTATFDTLDFSKRLQQLGFTREQAEGFAQMQREIIEDKLATKKDLWELEARLRAELKELEYRLTIRLGGMLAAAIAIIAALVKLL